jgi:hypothetical protein
MSTVTIPIPLETYLRTPYEPDVDYVDGETTTSFNGRF